MYRRKPKAGTIVVYDAVPVNDDKDNKCNGLVSVAILE